MKKTILALAAVATMVACSKDEIVNEAPKVPIAFNNAFVENTTRAIDGTYNNSNKPSNFLVYGYTQGDETGAQPVTIFNAVDVEYKTNSYEYDAKYTQYWIDGNKYGFAALVNADKEKVEINNVNRLPSKVTFTSDSEKDLLYATSKVDNVTTNYDAPVAFTFDHLLSKVHITFKNTITTNSDKNKYTYKVTNIHINDAISVADCDLSTKTWSNHKDSHINVEFGNITNKINNIDSPDAIEVGAVGTTEASATSHYARLLIPGNYNAEGNNPKNMHLIFTVETLINGQSVDKRDYKLVVEEELKAGHAYNFIISKGAPGKPIMFTVTKVNEWNTDHDNNGSKPDNTPLS